MTPTKLNPENCLFLNAVTRSKASSRHKTHPGRRTTNKTEGFLNKVSAETGGPEIAPEVTGFNIVAFENGPIIFEIDIEQYKITNRKISNLYIVI